MDAEAEALDTAAGLLNSAKDAAGKLAASAGVLLRERDASHTLVGQLRKRLAAAQASGASLQATMSSLAAAAREEAAESARAAQLQAAQVRAAALDAAAAHSTALSKAVEAGAAASLQAVNAEAARAAAASALATESGLLGDAEGRFTELQAASARRDRVAADLAAAAAQAHQVQLGQRDLQLQQAAAELASARTAVGVFSNTAGILQGALLQAGLAAVSAAGSASRRYSALQRASARMEDAAAAGRAERGELLARVGELEAAVAGGLAREEAGAQREVALQRRWWRAWASSWRRLPLACSAPLPAWGSWRQQWRVGSS